MEYPWPGNIRELEHAIEHAVILCHGKTILPSHLPSEITEPLNFNESPANKKEPSDQTETVVEALNLTDWNKAKTCRLLGISRPELYRLITKYNIKKPS